MLQTNDLKDYWKYTVFLERDFSSHARHRKLNQLQYWIDFALIEICDPVVKKIGVQQSNVCRPCWTFQPKQLYFSFSILFFILQHKTLWPFLSEQYIGNGSLKSAWAIQNLQTKTIINRVLFFLFLKLNLYIIISFAWWNKDSSVIKSSALREMSGLNKYHILALLA